MEQFQNIQVITDPEVAGIDFNVKRPYFRMRGRPVTEEQAFDIIRRTDTFFHQQIMYKDPPKSKVLAPYQWTPKGLK